MSGKGLLRGYENINWGALANEVAGNRGRGAAAGAAAAPARSRSHSKRSAAAKRIQRLFRASRGRSRSAGTRRRNVREAKRVGRLTRKALAAPYGHANGWIYDTRKAQKNPYEGALRWHPIPGQNGVHPAKRIPDAASYQVYDEGAAAWVPAQDPMGNYGGPYADPRGLAGSARYTRNQEEMARMYREAQEAEMRARAAAAVGIPEEDRKAIAARVGKAAQAQAKAAGATKADAGVAYKAAYEQAYEAMGQPGMSLDAALGAAVEVETAAGIAGPSAREARRALAKSGAAAGGV